MPLNIVLLRPQNWARLKVQILSTITAVEVFSLTTMFFFSQKVQEAVKGDILKGDI